MSRISRLGGVPVLLFIVLASGMVATAAMSGCAEPPPVPQKDFVESLWQELPYGTDVNEVIAFLDRHGIKYSYRRAGQYYGRQLMTRDAVHATVRNYKRSAHDIHDLRIVFYIDEDGRLERIWTR